MLRSAASSDLAGRSSPPNKALQLTSNSMFQLRFGSLLASTLGAWAASEALLAAAERPIRWAAREALVLTAIEGMDHRGAAASKPMEDSLRSIRIAVIRRTLALALALPLPALGSPIEYRISGFLTGDLELPLSLPVNLTDVPFHVSISGDAENAYEFGQITGFGTAYVNMGSASWTVNGVGTAYAQTAQVYSLPAVARVGFGWNGEIYPLDTMQPAERHFEFLGSPFASDPSYGLLNTAVIPISLSLLTELRNPSNTIPAYSTSINFAAQGRLILKDLTAITYTVVAVPEPSTGMLLMLGFAGLSGARFKRHDMRRPTSGCSCRPIR